MMLMVTVRNHGEHHFFPATSCSGLCFCGWCVKCSHSWMFLYVCYVFSIEGDFCPTAVVMFYHICRILPQQVLRFCGRNKFLEHLQFYLQCEQHCGTSFTFEVLSPHVAATEDASIGIFSLHPCRLPDQYWYYISFTSLMCPHHY